MPPCSAPSISCICASMSFARRARRTSRRADEHVARLLVAADQVGIAQAGEDLVQVVPGHPLAVEAEALDVAVSRAAISSHSCAAAGNAADVAVAVRALARGELRHHVVEPPLHLRIAGRGPHLRERGEVVPGRVAVEAGALPVRILRGLRREPGFGPIRREQPIGLQRADRLDVQILRVLERPSSSRTCDSGNVVTFRSGGGKRRLVTIAIVTTEAATTAALKRTTPVMVRVIASYRSLFASRPSSDPASNHIDRPIARTRHRGSGIVHLPRGFDVSATRIAKPRVSSKDNRSAVRSATVIQPSSVHRELDAIGPGHHHRY